MAVLDKLSVPINGDASQNIIAPKLRYRFRALFIGMGADDTKVATRNIISVTRPNLSFDQIEIHAYNSRVYIPGKHQWNEITIDFRDDIDSETTKLLDRQVAKQIDMADQSSPRAAGVFKFETHIENLDGANPNPTVFDIWRLSGCYITQLNYQDSNYTSAADFQMVQLQLRFDNAEHDVAGTDYLSDPVFQNSTDLSTAS